MNDEWRIFMNICLKNIPEGWAADWQQNAESVSSSITRKGSDVSFGCLEFELDLNPVLLPDSLLMTGAAKMGDFMKKYPAVGLRSPVKAENWLLCRIAKDDFLLIAIASWRIFSGEILFCEKRVTVRFYGDGRPFAPEENVPLEDIFIMRGGSEREVLDAYADFTATSHRVKLNLHCWRGWGTWDYYSAKFSDRSIRENLDELQKLAGTVNLLQIDDGYSVWGDWREIKPEVFPDGLAAVVQEAGARGLETGIWFAPFLAHYSANVVKEHPEWFLRREDESLRYYGSGGHVILDFSQDAVVEHIRRCVRSFRDAGIVYLKLDFLKAGTVFGRSQVPMTPYERFHRCLSAIREEAGADCYLLGCSAEFGPCIGHVDGMRVGPDISPNFRSAGISARCCMGAAPFHRKWYQCDPDYLVVRGDGMDDAERTSPTKLGTLTLNEATMWADFVSLTGNAVLAGDKLSLLTPERRKLVADTLKHASENPDCFILDYWRGGVEDCPAMIWSSGRLGVFNWTDSEQTFSLPGGGSAVLPARTSRIFEGIGRDGCVSAGTERPLVFADPAGVPFVHGSHAVPLSLGVAAATVLAFDHETGDGVLEGIYASLQGKRTLLGVPFEIGEKVIAVCKTDPVRELRIPVGRLAKTFYFLHAADYPVRGEWLSYILRFSDGAEMEHKVFLGRDIGNTDYHYSLPWNSESARIAWTEPATGRTLYVLELPLETERMVESIRITHPLQNGSHVLLAVSAV